MAQHVCPVWTGYILTSPIRKLIQSPRKILGPYIKKGMVVLDIGSAMGFFSIPMAEMTGPDGKVICVDIQQAMLDKLQKRADKHGVGAVIEKRLVSQNTLNIHDYTDRTDFALGFYMVHEVEDQRAFFQDVHKALKDKGRFLITEPKWHVPKKAFRDSIDLAASLGFEVVDTPKIIGGYTALLSKQTEQT